MESLPPELRSRFPVGGVFKTPPLLSADPHLGPLKFSAISNSLEVIFSSSSLLPPSLFPPPQQLSLPRFLTTSSSVPLSTSTSITSLFGPSQYNDASASFACNRLQLLRCPETCHVGAFFPAGTNSDKVGFVILDSEVGAQARVKDDSSIFCSAKQFNHPIIRILVNPIQNERFSSSGNFIGYLMVYTMYSVHWFAVRSFVKIDEPILIYLCSKLFKSCAIAGACWSSKIPELSAVLLENGNLFLFDLELFLHLDEDNPTDSYIKGTRLRVSWSNEITNFENNKSKWLGCEFGCDPNILIVASSNGAYLVNIRSNQCSMKCVANIRMLGANASIKEDYFQAFSKVSSDGFHVALASKRLLVLYDVRMPLRPVLQWVHNIREPCYIDAIRLSELRSSSRDSKYTWASESGHCILLGSFWNCEFSLFCYGPPPPSTGESLDLKLSNMCKSLYAWDLPSELSLSSHDRCSGSCLVQEELSKADLPEWINWQQKKDIVLGFGILASSISCKEVSEADEFGGFKLVRLMSSGKVESQRYCASWGFSRKRKEDNEVTSTPFIDYFSSEFDEDYKFTRRFKYVKLKYLEAFFNGNLASTLASKFKKPTSHTEEKDSFTSDFHAFLCEKLKKCGVDHHISPSPSVTIAFEEISLPTSISEIALRNMWSKLPTELLLLAFSSYSEFLDVLYDQKRVSLEFLVVTDLPQLPPFMLRQPSCRSNRWSQQVPRTDDIVGPVVPLPVLSALHSLRDGFGADDESSEERISFQCSEVMRVATDVAMTDSSSQFHEEYAVSLSDDREETWAASQNQKRHFLLHEPGACEPPGDAKHTKFVSKVFEKDPIPMETAGPSGLEMFDDLCPITLKFRENAMEFAPKELTAYKILKQQFLKRQEGFAPYQDFLSRCRLQKATNRV